MTLLDALQERGFMPREEGDWFDLAPRGDVLGVPAWRVRAELDDGTVIVYAMTGNGVVAWDARLSPGTPLQVITAVIDLAVADAVTGRE
jgi:hypothetical protein